MQFSYYNTIESFDSANYEMQYKKAIKKNLNNLNDKSEFEKNTNKKLIKYKKRNFELDSKYFYNKKYITINLLNGFNKFYKGYNFDNSKIENDYLLKLELPVVNNYHYLTYSLKLTGKYSENAILGIGFTNNKITWLYKIDTINNNINIIQKTNKGDKIHKIYNINNKLSNLEIFITIDKINNRIHLQLQNGKLLLEKWISDEIMFSNDNLYFSLYRFNKNDSFLFEKLKTKVDYYYEGNIDENIIELEDEVCQQDKKVDYIIFINRYIIATIINRYVIATIIFIIFMVITYLTRFRIK